jgi:hypothetical protein
MSYLVYTADGVTRDISEMVEKVSWGEVREEATVLGNILKVIFKDTPEGQAAQTEMAEQKGPLRVVWGPDGNAAGCRRLSGEASIQASHDETAVIASGKRPVERGLF